MDIADYSSDRIRRHAFFALLPPQAADALLPDIRVEALPGGARVFDEGDASDSLYLVLAGGVRLLKRVESDPPHLLALIAADGFFGEYGVLDGSVRSASAVADVDAVLARIPRDPFLRVLRNLPGLRMIGLMHHILNGVRASNARYVEELIKRVRMSALGASLNTIAHDLRNPLAVINMAAGLIRCQVSDPGVRETAAIIEEQVARLNAMVEDVLDFSRGKVRIERVPVNAAEILSQFERLNRAFLEQAGVALEIRAVDAHVYADTQKLLRVLQNLANNASEMFQDRAGRIAVSATAEGRSVVLRVADNGPGIPETIRARLFEPFATAGKTRGIGLGLAIVKAIVTSHDGTIRVETETGKGTTFLLALPRCNPDGTPWTEGP